MTDWMDRAARKGVPFEAFFPVISDRDRRRVEVASVLAVCGRCPVLRRCAQHALDSKICCGVVAGVGLGHDTSHPARARKRLERVARGEL